MELARDSTLLDSTTGEELHGISAYAVINGQRSFRVIGCDDTTGACASRQLTAGVDYEGRTATDTHTLEFMTSENGVRSFVIDVYHDTLAANFNVIGWSAVRVGPANGWVYQVNGRRVIDWTPGVNPASFAATFSMTKWNGGVSTIGGYVCSPLLWIENDYDVRCYEMNEFSSGDSRGLSSILTAISLDVSTGAKLFDPDWHLGWSALP